VIGMQLGHYKIVSQLGRGGMASVYKAEQTGLGRLVALKILQPSLAADEVIVQRFQQEARIAANLHHAHIVTIYDVGEVEGTYYIAMRYIEGENLGQMLRREGPLSPERALGVLEQVAEALDFAHSRTILHRDIKPANVMVEPGDVLTLTDFGIARAGEASHLTATRMVIGTPEYMSPEQARGDVIDKRSDLYALGVLMYETLGGRPPFSAASTPSLLYLHVHEPPPPLHQLRPDLPRALSDVVSKSLAKDPNERFQSGREMVAAAKAALTEPSPTVFNDHHTSAMTSATVVDPNFGRGGGSRPAPGTPAPYQPGTPLPYQQPRTPAPIRPTPPPPGGQRVEQPAARANATGTLTPPPIPSAMDRGAYGPGPTFQPTATPPGPEKKRSGTWVLGPIIAAVALIAVGALVVVTQTGLLDRATATPTPTQVAARPAVTPTVGAAVETKPAVPSATPASGQVAAKPAEVTPVPKPTDPPTLAPTPAPTNTPPPPTPNPEQRIATAQAAVAAGDYPKAIEQLRAMRDDPAVKADAKIAPMVDDTLRMTHIVYGRQLLEQNKLDDSYGQFAEALKIAPNDADAVAGQKQVILTKNYGIMEANWDKDDEAAIKALEENMILDPGFRETRPKLYSLLIAKADRLLGGGDRDGAFPVLMRALEVQPDAGEAQKRLASYTPTPVPTATPVPYVPPRATPVPYTPPPQRTNPAPAPAPSEPYRPFTPEGKPV
jgi:serine/threonine-protein kinase